MYNLGDRVVVEEDTVVLGVNFLRKFYTVFDLEKSRVGIYEPSISQISSFIGGTYFYAIIFVVFLIIMSILFFLLRTRKVKEEPEEPPITGGRMHNNPADMKH